MVGQIFVTKRQTICGAIFDCAKANPRFAPLRNQLLCGVLDQVQVAVIGETGGETPNNAEALLHLPQKQTTRI
jgi:hypothetical protein